ncbi:hypothetical protein GVN18_39915 [Pseudomonas sp. ODNR1LW]|nr:hypothetical protein [Pseudomonas sp. ODNR1LW]
MFAPHHFPFLINYFEGIDGFVARKLNRPVPPSETTLTEEFCAMMDAGNQRAEGLLSYDIDALNRDLSSMGHDINADFRVQVHQHARGMEAYVSQADFGLILELDNRVLPGESWSEAYLMQAKRLFAGPSAEGYSLASGFHSATPDQDKRIEILAEILGEDSLKYCLYCPPTTGYESTAVAAVRTVHATRLGRQIFDYGLGFALHEHVLQTGGIDSGIWVSGSNHSVKTAFDLHNSAFGGSLPFAWFILKHLRSSSWPIGHDMAPPTKDHGRTKGIATGDPSTCQGLISELGERARKADVSVENLKVLPASSVTIRVRIGPAETPLPPPQS